MPRAWPKVEPTGTQCRICGGDVVRWSNRVYVGDPMRRIIGPGSRNQMSTITKIYCDDCGIMYNHVVPHVRLPNPDSEP